MSLNNHLRRHRYKQMLLIHQPQKCGGGQLQLRSISSSRLITTQRLKGNNLSSPSLFNTYYKSLPFSTSRVIGNNHSSLSMSSSYYIHNSMIRAPSVVDIVRTLSSKGISKTKNASSTPTIENNINTRSPSSFLQKVKIETQYMLQLLQVLIPRILAFVGTLHLTSEYGVQTISCEGPSMEPTIIDGSNTCVLIERWSHRLFGLESRNDNHDVTSTEERKKKKILDSTIEIEEEQEENSHDSKETIIIQDEPPKDSWYTLLHGIWKQHFASGLSNGDVIILHHPGKEATICKRIIGIPGDTIIRTDGGDDDEYSTTRRVVPPGHLWIEGDNSLNSLDSRSYGTVPASLVIGKVVCRLWPLREYVLLGMDANGVEHWKRVSARIGRGGRTSFVKGNNKEGSSHVLTT